MKYLLAAFTSLLFLSSVAANDAVPAKQEKSKTDDSSTYTRRIKAAKLSPDGKYIAAVTRMDTDLETFRNFARLNIAVGSGAFLMKADTFEEAGTLANARLVQDGFTRVLREVKRVSWITNEIVAVEFLDQVIAVNLKGEELFHLGRELVGKAERNNPDSPWVIVSKGKDYKRYYIVNPLTKETREYRILLQGKPLQSVFDSAGRLRAITVLDSEFWNDATKIINWYYDRDEWRKLAEFKVTDRIWLPQTIADDGRSLVVLTNIGRDTAAIQSFDVDKLTLGEVMAAHPTEDIHSATGLDQANFTGVVTEGMKPKSYWFEPRWAKAQQTADASLSNRVNLISGDPAKRVIVFSYSDVDPGAWYLLDMEQRSLRKFAVDRVKLDADKSRPMEIVSYESKDGLKIPAYLTRPAGQSGPGPMVVLVHGGPAMRDHWGWDPEVQLLAEKGYVVFQPQFRGSSGFGAKYEEAGFGQWGRAMQDDVTAGVEAMVSRGIADPKRVCIYGASYGGYAALWGLVRTPYLYRCGVSFAGVSDLRLMFDDRSDRNSNKIAREMLRYRIGDASTQAASFDDVSPLKHVGRIKAPVLLMHGNADERVPIVHSQKMRKALQENNKLHEWHEFDKEGHTLGDSANRGVYFEKLITFLDKHIGAKATSEATAPAANTEAKPK